VKPDDPLPTTLWGLVAGRATATPDATMLADERDRTLTFGQFAVAAEEAAAGFAALGEGTVVSWQLPTTIEAVVTMAALARLGAVQNPVIPILRRREVAFITAQVGARLHVVPDSWRGFDYASLAAEVAAEVGTQPVVCRDDERAGSFGLRLPAGEATTLPAPPSVPPGSPPPVRWIYYTSGTTAAPKGARHTDGSTMATSNGLCLVAGVRADDVGVVPIPVTHIGGMMLLSTMLRTGCTMLLVDTFDPARTPFTAARLGASVLFASGLMSPVYLEAQRRHGPERLFPRLRFCGNGGAPVPPGAHERVKQELGGVGIVSSWGLTECPAVSSPPLSPDDDRVAFTVGPPVPGVELRVVASGERECGPGEEGELRVRGPQLFQGYVDPALDADAFDEQGFLRTGDLGTTDDDGYIRITGRLKDVIIRNAENISALEVEEVLATHPKVADVAVIGLPDARTGERACAVVRLAPDAVTLTLAELADHCRAAGLAIQKVPEQLEIVENIPRNDLGKIQKRDLRARFEPAR
jgi:cyclohexanecarboxylate-CoA ligase